MGEVELESVEYRAASSVRVNQRASENPEVRPGESSIRPVNGWAMEEERVSVELEPSEEEEEAVQRLPVEDVEHSSLNEEETISM